MKHAVQFVSRMLHCSFVILALSAILRFQPSAFAQGPLGPPGPPGPTMITLSQIEPRTPISALPATITISGSYYVTTNLTCTTCTSGTNGITILVNDVTVDLSGFTLQGVAGSGSGITVSGPERNLAIRNGVLDSWGNNGVLAVNGYDSQFERLRESNSGATGLATGSNCLLLVCSVNVNGTDGILAGNNSTVKDCVAAGNTGSEFSNGILVGSNCTVIGCTATGNRFDGINVGINCTVKDCTAGGNTGAGINLGNNCTVKDCTSSGNGGGMNVGNNCSVKDCTISGNSNDGIFVSGNNCQIVGNTCSTNGEFGIEIVGVQNRIDGNSVGHNTSYGIITDSLNVNNCVTRNSSPGLGYGSYTGNNDYAPTGSVSTATNPWTNF